MFNPVEITIENLGAKGDGIGTYNGEKIYVPYALTGEHVEIELDGTRGSLTKILEPSPQRVKPSCTHFTSCGGCALQHLEHKAYLEWKQTQMKEAFASQQVELAGGVLQNVHIVPEFSRRRIVLAARRTRKSVLLGFRQALSHQIIDITECNVMSPALLAALPGLRSLLRLLLSRKGEARIWLQECDQGLDVAIENVRALDEQTLRAQVAEQAQKLDIDRLIIDEDIVLQKRAPQIRLGPAMVKSPSGTFVQASVHAQQVMSDIVCNHLIKARQVADLFSGMGTFAFPLAQSAQVLAVESDQAALDALEQAALETKGIKAIKTLRRDLFHDPLSKAELKEFDGLVFDPPRAGAEAQAKALAQSEITKIAAVSCNPVTLARDAALLIAGGYRLEQLIPIDQFLYAPHIEAVALFSKR